MESGIILVNTGDGKGKTTAALGTTLRALGQGFKVAFVQFIKSQETGEGMFLKQYAEEHPGRLYYNRFGLGFLGAAPSPADRAKAAEAMAKATELMAGGYDLLVLDEVCVAAAKGLIEVEDLKKMVQSKPPQLNLIMTGRGCPQEIVELADTVTDMVPIKHAYEKGIQAKKGIEF